MIDLREIVKVLRDNPGSFWDAKFIYPIIEAVVEERARFNYVMAVIAKKEPSDPDKYWHNNEDIITDVKECWTRLKDEHKNDYRTQALHDLNLQGMWPVKGE